MAPFKVLMRHKQMYLCLKSMIKKEYLESIKDELRTGQSQGEIQLCHLHKNRKNDIIYV